MCLMPSSPAETNAQLLIFLTEVKWDFRGSVSVQNRLYRLVHLGDGRHAVDPAGEAPGPILGEDRRGLGAIFGEAVAHRLFLVVGAALKPVPSANVAGAFARRPPVPVAITLAADTAAHTAGPAADPPTPPDHHPHTLPHPPP